MLNEALLWRLLVPQWQPSSHLCRCHLCFVRLVITNATRKAVVHTLRKKFNCYFQSTLSPTLSPARRKAERKACFYGKILRVSQIPQKQPMRNAHCRKWQNILRWLQEYSLPGKSWGQETSLPIILRLSNVSHSATLGSSPDLRLSGLVHGKALAMVLS